MTDDIPVTEQREAPPAAVEPPEKDPEKDPAEVLAERIAALAERIGSEGKERVAAAKRIGPLTKPPIFGDPKKLGKELAKVRKKLAPETAAALGIEPLLAEVDDYLAGAAERIRLRLGRELKAACEAAGVPFAVLSREDPVEVRLAPLMLRISFVEGRGDLLFAREVVATTHPDAEAILAARARALRTLDYSFDPKRFFSDCLSAWRAALAAADRPEGERVELLDFLPYLAIARQTRKFKASPAKETFKSYGKAMFAYDVLRLRRAGALSQGGLRLNLGVATGTTASQKDRVVYLEDEHGDGEYKLTVFFTSSGER